MTAPIKIPKKSDEYHREKLLYKQKLWEGRYISQVTKKENKAICILMFDNCSVKNKGKS